MDYTSSQLTIAFAVNEPALCLSTLRATTYVHGKHNKGGGAERGVPDRAGAGEIRIFQQTTHTNDAMDAVDTCKRKETQRTGLQEASGSSHHLASPSHAVYESCTWL